MLGDTRWRVVIQLSTDPLLSDWLSFADNPAGANATPDQSIRQLCIRLALLHPFMDRFSGPTAEQIEPLLRIAAALALAETTAREGGVKKAGAVRIFVNDLLRNGLSQP